MGLPPSGQLFGEFFPLTAEQAGTFLLQQGVHIDHFLCDDLVAELGSFGSPPWHICPQLLL